MDAKIDCVADPQEFRRLCREGFSGPSSGHAPGHVQANMVILPEAEAADSEVEEVWSEDPAAAKKRRKHRRRKKKRAEDADETKEEPGLSHYLCHQFDDMTLTVSDERDERHEPCCGAAETPTDQQPCCGAFVPAPDAPYAGDPGRRKAERDAAEPEEASLA